jgi:curved DNA-binding protein CbpA
MAKAVSIDVSKLQLERPEFADIRSVYKKAVLKYHPDKRANKSDVGFKELNNLYETLNTIYSRHVGGGKTRKELHKRIKTYKKRRYTKTIDKRIKSRKLIRLRKRV